MAALRRRVTSIIAALAAASGLLCLYFFTIRPNRLSRPGVAGDYENYGILPSVILPATLLIVAVGLAFYAASSNIYRLTEGWVEDHSSDEDYLTKKSDALHGSDIDLDHLPRFYLHISDRGENPTGRPRTGKIAFDMPSVHRRFPIGSYYRPEVMADADEDAQI